MYQQGAVSPLFLGEGGGGGEDLGALKNRLWFKS